LIGNTGTVMKWLCCGREFREVFLIVVFVPELDSEIIIGLNI